MNPLWEDNSIQFPRLISEWLAAGIPDEQWTAVRDSMDLSDDELNDLFDRAQAEWDSHVGTLGRD